MMTTREHSGVGDGFAVSVETLLQVRTRVDEATETHLRARDREAGGDLARSGAAARPGWGAREPQRVPRWHTDLDRRWDAHREALLRADDVTSHALAETVRNYLDTDAEIAHWFSSIPTGPDGPTGRTPIPGPGGGPVMPAALPVLEKLTGLDHAVGVWRQRRDGTHDIVEAIASAVDGLAWSGAAADAFHDWAHRHLDRWRTLAEAADTIGAALADPRDDADDNHGPDLPALTEHTPPLPAPPAPAAQPAAEPSFTPTPVTTPSSPTTGTPAELPVSPPPELPAPEVSVTATAVSPGQRDSYIGDICGALGGPSRHDASAPRQPDAGTSDDQMSGGAPPDSEAPDSEAAAPAEPGGEPASVSIPQPRAESDASTGAGTPEAGSDVPAASMSMAPQPVMPPDAAALGGGHLAAATPLPANSDTGSSVSPMASSAAVAGAAALARADRAHYVVREITVPEPRSSTPAPPGPVTGRQEVTSAPRLFRPLAPVPGWPMPPPARSDLGVVPSAVGSGPAADPVSAPGPDPQAPGGTRPGRALHTRPAGGHLPMWVNLNPGSGQGAWIDLAARPGLGLHGPGAAAIARTALCELHLHTATHVLIPRPVLAGLLTGPDQPHLPLLDDIAITDRIHFVDDSHQALQALHARLNAPPTPDSTGPTPTLLVVPAPTTSHSHAALAATVEQLRTHPAGVLAIGAWPHGATLDIDPDHRVRSHHHPASTDLTGAHLHPTRPAELARSLHPARPAPTHNGALRPHKPEPDTDPTEGTTRGIATVLDDTGHQPSDRPGTAALDEQTTGSAPCRTPLALSVLGPIQLRYRRTTTDNDHHGDHRGPAAETWVRITGLPQPSIELLAFLAAHPAGVTRATIIEALWPHSTAAKPENSLYQAKSRLVSAVGDATSDDTVKELLINPDGRWSIDPHLVTVDYWTLLEASTPGLTDTERRATYRAATHAYGGLFAADLTGTWAHDIRESTRRRFLEITEDLAQIEVHDNPRTALALLERARNLEPLNEANYRSIIRIQILNGYNDEARRTYDLLRSQLAYIDAEPDPATVSLLKRPIARPASAVENKAGRDTPAAVQFGRSPKL